MKTVNLKPLLLLLIPVVLILSATSCHKTVQCPVLPVALVVPEMNFRVVDKTTGNDLFFGSTAIYKTNQLKVAQIINGNADSTVLFVDSLQKLFIIRLPHAQPVNTVTMRVANLPQDNLVFNVSTTGGSLCSVGEPLLDEVLYNGVSVYTAANGPAIVVLKK